MSGTRTEQESKHTPLDLDRYEGHTPEPWRAQGPSPGTGRMDDGGDYAIVGNYEIIGEAIYRTAKNTFQPAKINARLFADAPRLLAELRHTRRLLKAGERLAKRSQKIIATFDDTFDGEGPNSEGCYQCSYSMSGNDLEALRREVADYKGVSK